MKTRALLTLAALAMSADAALAQSCVIETGKPALISGARRYVTLIGAGDRPSEKPNHLKSGARVLVEQTEKIDNQIGRWFLLGKLYTLWVRQEGVNPITTRGFLTLQGDPNAQVDLLVEIRKAFDAVEAINPACADSTKPYWGSIYGTLYNEALEMRNAQQYDSAETLARRALVMNPKSTGSWNVIAMARNGKGDTVGYFAALDKVIEVGAVDPDGADLRKTAMYNLGVLKLNQAMSLTGDAQMAKAKEAEKYFRDYLALAPGSGEASSALARALRVQGDESGMAGIFAGMVNEPEKYSSFQLFEGAVGVISGDSTSPDDYLLAIKLFQNGLAKNPYFRDALFNLANAYFQVDSAQQMIGVLGRLLEVAPNDADNLRLKAGAWQRLGRSSQDKAVEKMAQDSTLYYLEAWQQAPVAVKVSWIPQRDGAALDVAAENRSDAAKTYAINFEFLDAKGAVVTTGTATLSDVASKSAKAVRIEGKGAGIVAYRYKMGS
jgi:tetratricopeptide (TPR) repeat protein